jgi:hypothetical protein
MTPLHIMMLLHYYAVAEPYSIRNDKHRFSSAVRDYRLDLYRRGLIQPITDDGSRYVVVDEPRAKVFAEFDPAVRNDHGHYGATAKGKALVDKLCKTGATK